MIETAPRTSEANEQTRAVVMDKFNTYKDELQGAARESEDRRDAKRIAVVVSLYEEDATGVTGKMFAHTLQTLYQQAVHSGIALDVFMIANNSGGPTPEVATALEESVRAQVERLADSWGYESNKSGQPHIRIVQQSLPADGQAPTEAISLDLEPLSTSVDENAPDSIRGSRFWYIKQARAPQNSGKLRALRDMSAELYTQMKDHGYSPDAVLQIDAESVLEYSELYDPLVKRSGIPPLKILANSLYRISKSGVGSSDRFERIDRETGEPTQEPRPGPHHGFFVEKKDHDEVHFLPGGGMIVRPEVYVAGMKAMTETIPSIGLEDYTLSKIVMESEAQAGTPVGDTLLVANLVTHLNRVPAGKGYIDQLQRWVSGRRAVDQIFPSNSRMQNREAVQRQVRLLRHIVSDRITHISKGDMQYARQLWQDILELPDIAKALGTKHVEDIFKDDASWRHHG